MGNKLEMTSRANLTAQDVKNVYFALLGREPESNVIINNWVNGGESLVDLIRSVTASDEAAAFRQRQSKGIAHPSYILNAGENYSAPRSLAVSWERTGRVLLQGSCLLEGWSAILSIKGYGSAIDTIVVASTMPDSPPHPFSEYDFRVAQIPLRGVLSDGLYAEWLRAPYGDEQATENLLHRALSLVDFWLERYSEWAAKIPTFVLNYSQPQYSIYGRLVSNGTIIDNIGIMRRINDHMARRIRELGMHMLDIDALSSTYGRRYVQDDSLWIYTHGALLGRHDIVLDRDRIEPHGSPSDYFDFGVDEFICALWLEVNALFRSLKSTDAIKMVCFDLDDTLWRGVLAEQEEIDVDTAVEGWPLGMAEAVLTLRKRGLILALVSKNTLERIEPIFKKVFGSRLLLEDFSILKINWENKVDNILSAIADANILTKNVLFVDDNPRERQTVKNAIAGIRTLEEPHYYWKKTLLWSPETQPPIITNESARRSDMIRAQVTREGEKRKLSRTDFLNEIGLRVTLTRVMSEDDKKFVRTLELINKTNQFNTTGKRWSRDEMAKICTHGLVVVAEAEDKYASYGLILVAIEHHGVIRQVVMSCRVIGLDVELAALSYLVSSAAAASGPIKAISRDTEANLLSRDLFVRAGFRKDENEGTWSIDQASPPPTHIVVEISGRV